MTRTTTEMSAAACVCAAMVGVVATLLLGCSRAAPLTAAERGRRVYMANCITCHNRDPAQPGSAGPDIAGASRDLLEARVVRGSYPPGYRPKRSTKAMVPLPHLAAYIDDLAAFLATKQDG